MSFSKIFGQKKAVSLISSDLHAGRIAGSYLFVGSEGVGKRTTALEFAKAINCQNSSEFRVESLEFQNLTTRDSQLTTACDACSSCRKVDSGTHPDLFVLDFESQARLLQMTVEEKARQKNFQINAIRLFIAQSCLTPLEGKKKVFIIDGAEFLTSESANALLKVLEESSPHSHWILVAVSAERVIPTIRSRCRRISFAPLAAKEIQSLLNNSHSSLLNPSMSPLNNKGGGRGVEAKSESEIKRVSEICDGSVAHALFLLEKESLDLGKVADELLWSSEIENVLEFSIRIIGRDKRTNRKRAEQFLKILLLKMARNLRAQPRLETSEHLSDILSAQEELRRNISPRLVLDSLLLSLSPSPCPSPSRGED